MGLNKTATYPSSVWDGDSGNRDSDDNRQSAPDYRDWERSVAEIAAVQTELDTEKGYIDTLQTDVDALEAGVTVEIDDAGDTAAPNVLLVTESRKILANEGTLGEKNFHTLPLAAAGLVFTFICNDTDGIRATANTSDTIRVGSSISKAAGYIESTVVGSTVTLVAIDATEWIAVSFSGTWSVETS